MSDSANRFPYGTKASFSTVPDVRAVCDTCGWKGYTRNALALAAQHHGRTGHRVSCEVFYTVVWKSAVEPDLPLFPQEAGK